ncbi:hypothetical protein EON81_23495 [bacterium]|nr:MAG: hypothetical protein EON81_23495 [bacterium]
MAHVKRPTPLEVPIPRPVRDNMFASNRLLSLVFVVILLLVVGVVTGKKRHYAEAFLHDGVQVEGRVTSVRYYSGRSQGSIVAYTYPVGTRNMVVFDYFTVGRGRDLEASGTIMLWYLPHEPAVHTVNFPTEDDVRLARLLQIGSLAVVMGGSLIGFGVSWRKMRAESADLRYGVAYLGHVSICDATVTYIYGPEGRTGKIPVGSKLAAEQLWPRDKEIVVLQREGHLPRVWESIQAVELDPTPPISVLRSGA